MKTIIAGSRNISSYKVVRKAIKASGFRITKVVSGNAQGVDQLGLQYAHESNLPSEKHSAQWYTYGKAAGPIRNKHMAENIGAEALIAVWDGKSPGTLDMITVAQANGLKVYVYEVDGLQTRLKTVKSWQLKELDNG